MNSKQLDIILKRFTTLFTRFSTKADKSRLNMQERVKLCKTLAKSESQTFIQVSSTL